MDFLNTIQPENNLICRICLIQSEDMKKIHFSKFEYCTGIDISETPQSTNICLHCESSLNDFYTFKEKCIESHVSLIQMYGIITESIEIDPNLFKIEPIKENSNDEYQIVEEVMENTQTDEDELIEVIMMCEDNEMSNDAVDMESDNSDFEYTLSPNMKDESETDIDCEEQKPDSVKKIKSKTVETTICEHCGKSFSKKSFASHMRKHVDKNNTKVEEEEVKCDKCDRTFKNKGNLKYHTTKVHKNVGYACTLCDKSFKNYITRKDHMVFAHGAKYRYSCTLCPFKTQGNSNYVLHMRSHTGEKPIKCTECSKTFSCNSYLKSHMATHSNEKNFLCEYCNKSFSLMHPLRAHLKIHTQERNYVCPVDFCKKTFIHNHNLKAHMKAIHPAVETPPPGTIVSIKPKENRRK